MNPPPVLIHKPSDLGIEAIELKRTKKWKDFHCTAIIYSCLASDGVPLWILCTLFACLFASCLFTTVVTTLGDRTQLSCIFCSIFHLPTFMTTKYVPESKDARVCKGWSLEICILKSMFLILALHYPASDFYINLTPRKNNFLTCSIDNLQL